MLNFPISGGTSGHLLGGVLAASLLGIPFGILSLAVVVSVQCLVFSDGGLSVLGANVFNMALIGAGLGGVLASAAAGSSPGPVRRYVALAGASWLSVVLASLAVAAELSLAGVIGFGTVASAMAGTHALIGVGEAAITVGCCLFLRASVPARAGAGRRLAVPLGAAVLVALLLSPFASGLPDGLEWVADRYRFLHAAAPSFAAPFPDYRVLCVEGEFLSTVMAALAGVAVTFGVAWLVGRAAASPGRAR